MAELVKRFELVWSMSSVLYPAVATPIAFMGLRSYLFIGIAWLMHSCWDIAHHVWNNPIWPFMPTSSFGCMIFDAVLVIWFIAGDSSHSAQLSDDLKGWLTISL